MVTLLFFLIKILDSGSWQSLQQLFPLHTKNVFHLQLTFPGLCSFFTGTSSAEFKNLLYIASPFQTKLPLNFLLDQQIRLFFLDLKPISVHIMSCLWTGTRFVLYLLMKLGGMQVLTCCTFHTLLPSSFLFLFAFSLLLQNSDHTCFENNGVIGFAF